MFKDRFYFNFTSTQKAHTSVKTVLEELSVQGVMVFEAKPKGRVRKFHSHH